MASPSDAPIEPCGFLHLPKAAGSSVAAALIECYGHDRVGHLRMDQRILGSFTDFESLAPELQTSMARSDVAAQSAPESAPDVAAGDRISPALELGHFSLSTLRRLVPDERIVTVLREPRARLLSHHLYWCVRPERENLRWGSYQCQRLAEPGLRPFLESAAAAHQHDNLICRLLVDDTPLCPADAPIADGDHEQVAELAWAALERIGLVTFVEHDAMWEQLSEFVGAHLPPRRDNDTTAKSRVPAFTSLDLDAPTLELIERSTRADRIVYERVLCAVTGASPAEAATAADGRFEAQVDRYRASLATLHAGAEASDEVAVEHRRSAVSAGSAVSALRRTARRVLDTVRR